MQGQRHESDESRDRCNDGRARGSSARLSGRCSRRGSTTLSSRVDSSNRPEVANLLASDTGRVGASRATEELRVIGERDIGALLNLSAHSLSITKAFNDRKKLKLNTYVIKRASRMTDLHNLYTSIRPRRDPQLRKPRVQLRETEATVAGLVVVFQQRDVEARHVVAQAKVDVRQRPGVRGTHGYRAAG